MKNKGWKKGWHLFKDFALYFRKGWQSGQLVPYTKSFISSALFYLNRFRQQGLYVKGIQHGHIAEEEIKKLKETAQGLYSLLPPMPPSEGFSYSILLPVRSLQPLYFKKSLESVLNQSPPFLEVLIGLKEEEAKAIEKILSVLPEQERKKITLFFLPPHQPLSAWVNALAREATQAFLFVMGEKDWIRPDLLFRYEQTLRLFPHPHRVVLFCNHNRLNAKDYFIPFSESHQPDALHFPFFFQQISEKGLLIPTSLWRKEGGLDLTFQGAECLHLLLQLDRAGATFQHVPFCLYSLRALTSQEEESPENCLKALQNYTDAKQLGWRWYLGYQPHTMRAVPPLCQGHCIQVIIPYKDQKELTLRCVHRLLQQKEVDLILTAVDNRSEDPSIAEDLRVLGAEVIEVNEPFNYSRLNNLAVKQTRIAAHCDCLLFLNNDVELEPRALSEMLRWIDQPPVGLVGCRLHYPDGRLQHGGVQRSVQMDEQREQVMRWEHREKFYPFEQMEKTKQLGFVDAVTAACALIKREVFLKIGGFDEVWYPIGYSDTHLAVKLQAMGLKCFYTPYAVGTHHESVSRKTSSEDYENSAWLHHLIAERK